MAGSAAAPYVERMKSICIALVLLVSATSLFAHCDSVNGPVIVDAKAALDKRDVTPVLKWVPAPSEREIRDAFAQAVAVRGASPEAKELADRWFFETLVRVHRESEGAPYTGIKGADFKPEEGIEAADKAIDAGSLEATEKALIAEITAGLRKRFAAVREAKAHADHNVGAGRHYVHSYVEFIHYVERLHQAATTNAAHAAAESAAHAH